MTTYIDHFKARICYGYKRNAHGRAYVDEEQARVVHLIFDRYLAGDTLRGIAQYLTEQGIPTPSGKPQWNLNKVDVMLADVKYIPYIISASKFKEALEERWRRSNMELCEDMTKRRKATRYSKNVLSGLFVCEECGSSYRRLTRSSGEIEWRCASRVEHGNTFCKHSPTLKEADLIHFLCSITGTTPLDLDIVRRQIDKVTVGQTGTLTPVYKTEQRIYAGMEISIC